MSHCPPSKDLRDYILTTVFATAEKTEVSYTQWVSTDRSEIRTITEPVDIFIDKFCERLLRLRKHSFMAKKQNNTYKNIKENLKEGEILVKGDFSENYKIIVQDESQSFHWNNTQVTLHPFVCYFRDTDNNIKHVSYVPISECNKHDTTAVYIGELHQICTVSLGKSSTTSNLKVDFLTKKMVSTFSYTFGVYEFMVRSTFFRSPSY